MKTLTSGYPIIVGLYECRSWKIVKNGYVSAKGRENFKKTWVVMDAHQTLSSGIFAENKIYPQFHGHMHEAVVKKTIAAYNAFIPAVFLVNVLRV